MIGVANHPNGYTQELVDWLTPFLNTCATLIVGYRNSRDRTLAEEALRESKAMLQIVLDSIPERVFWKDRDSVYLGCNQHFARDAGLESARQIVGKNDFELSWHREAERYQADDRQVIHSGVPKLNFEETQTRPDGTQLWLKTSKVPLRDLDANVTGVIGVYEDITEQKLSETELANYREHLEELVMERTRSLRNAQDELVRKERLATLGQLTATVSHELRNPLGAMRPSLYIIEKHSDRNDARLQQAIERIDRNIDRCDRIIDELLDFTRITELNLSATRIDEWLELVIDEQVIPADIHVEKNLSLKDVELPVDRDRLRRAVINVVDNACHAMLENDQLLKARKGSRLDITTGSHDGRVEIIITDSGPGMPQEVREKIFEPLFSTKSFGVGLGMPAVKQIMQQHRGGVEIETAAGHGTSITLWLPGNAADLDGEEVAA
ncbi:MAG: ATP-binding protein [Gammaproteobacteria bacterium]